MAEYQFYIQDIKTGTKKNIEADFNAKYCEFKGLLDFEVKNTYTESYPEADGDRVYVPDTVRFKSQECQLRLLFHSQTAQADSLAFSQFVQGKLVEYSDTFRNVFVKLLCTKAPSTGKERLFGDDRYREMTYTFTNVDGKAYTTSQISQ